jgi:hypothetical protein
MPTKVNSPQAPFTGANEVSTSAPIRIETEHHIIHLHPRISATKLAEYVIADPSRQETIVKQAKRASKAILIPYTRVRHAFGEALSKHGLDPEFLKARAEEVESTESQNMWHQHDNVRSAEALRRLATLAPQIGCANVERIHRPADGWPALSISGVRVSVQPELVFVSEHRGVKKVGAAILNTGQSETLSLARGNGRSTVGDYLTVLVYRLLDQRLTALGVPLHTQCYAIDVFRDTIYTAPAACRTLLKHIDAACRMIALQWEGIEFEVEESVDA